MFNLVGMKTVGVFAAKTHLSDLLEVVARGETILITKRGKPMATLSAASQVQSSHFKARLKEYRKKFANSLGKYSVAEINELKSAGRK